MGIRYVCELCDGNIPVEREPVGRKKGRWHIEYAVYKDRAKCMTGHLCEKCQRDIMKTGENIHSANALSVTGKTYKCAVASCDGKIAVSRQSVGRMVGPWLVQFNAYRDGKTLMVGHVCEKCMLDIYENGDPVYLADKVGNDFEPAANYIPVKQPPKKGK